MVGRPVPKFREFFFDIGWGVRFRKKFNEIWGLFGRNLANTKFRKVSGFERLLTIHESRIHARRAS